jgi:hypothetical protein
MEAIEQTQAMDRHRVRDRAARQFDSGRIVDSVITAVNKARLGGGITTAATAPSLPQRKTGPHGRARSATVGLKLLVSNSDR